MSPPVFRVLPCRSQARLTAERIAAGLGIAVAVLCMIQLYYAGIAALLLLPVYWARDDRHSITMPLRVAATWLTTYLAMMIWIDARMVFTASMLPAVALGVLLVIVAGVFYGQLLKLAFDVFARPVVYVSGPACRHCGYERSNHLWAVCPECGSKWTGIQ